MELLVSWKCVGVKFVISCRKKPKPNQLSKIVQNLQFKELQFYWQSSMFSINRWDF